MAEYIEREAALHEIERREALMVGDKCVSVSAIKSFIKNRPAADVAPVVRCKDCKYGEVDDADFPAQYLCRYNGVDWNNENHFCSYGERKGGDSYAKAY